MDQLTETERSCAAMYLAGEPPCTAGYALVDAADRPVQRGTLEEMAIAWRTAAGHDVRRGDGSALTRGERMAALLMRRVPSVGSDSRQTAPAWESRS